MMLRPHTRALSRALALSLALTLTACGPKDADIKTGVDQAIAGAQGVTADVSKGVVTISGQFADEATKASTEAAVKAVKGVKSVVDNATITPPAPVVISPDDSLRTNVTAALKDFPTLSADVKDGVVTLTGEIKKSELPKAMKAVSALKPKKIENKATVKK
jgi:hyperosmotically inducible periplasmic protein